MKPTIPLLTLLLLICCGLSAASAQRPGLEERNKKFLERFPEADLDKDGKLSREELHTFQEKRRSEQRTKRPAGRTMAPPTHADVSYGDHQKQAFDLWLAKSKDGKPTPLVIYIHGGGFRGGDKSGAKGQPVQDYLDQGISFASMNYRLSDVGPYPIMMHDCARGLQFIRSKAKEWKIDDKRIACYGGSAGAGISLWLAFHPDRAEPGTKDQVEVQSTRIVAAGTMGGQSTYDMHTFREWFDIPDLPPHPALISFYAVKEGEDWDSPRVRKLMKDASPITHLTKDDPPVFMTYSRGDVPVEKESNPGLWVHHARLGLKLQEAMEQLDLECHVTWRDHPSKNYDSIHAFLQDKVRSGGGDR